MPASTSTTPVVSVNASLTVEPGRQVSDSLHCVLSTSRVVLVNAVFDALVEGPSVISVRRVPLVRLHATTADQLRIVFDQRIDDSCQHGMARSVAEASRGGPCSSHLLGSEIPAAVTRLMRRLNLL